LPDTALLEKKAALAEAANLEKRKLIEEMTIQMYHQGEANRTKGEQPDSSSSSSLSSFSPVEDTADADSVLRMELKQAVDRCQSEHSRLSTSTALCVAIYVCLLSTPSAYVRAQPQFAIPRSSRYKSLVLWT